MTGCLVIGAYCIQLEGSPSSLYSFLFRPMVSSVVCFFSPAVLGLVYLGPNTSKARSHLRLKPPLYDRWDRDEQVSQKKTNKQTKTTQPQLTARCISVLHNDAAQPQRWWKTVVESEFSLSFLGLFFYESFSSIAIIMGLVFVFLYLPS